MWARRWLLPIALGAIALIALGDAVWMRGRPPEAKAVVRDDIGLAAAPDGDGVRVEWNRNARAVRQATHGLLFIEDGKYQSQFSLSDQQLTDSTIHYWPETKNVRFRLELYHGAGPLAEVSGASASSGATASDEVSIVAERSAVRIAAERSAVSIAAERSAPVVHTASRTVVERARPSPFERTRPEVVRHQMTPPVVSAAAVREREPALDAAPAAVEKPVRRGLLSRIPLLRRLKKHPQTTDPLPSDDVQSRR